MVATGEMTIEEVKKDDLYASHIRGEAESHDFMEERMRKLKKENNKKYKKQLKQPFANYAFTKCYKPKPNSKTRKVGSGLKNKRNKSCSFKNSTSCCPHMPPDKNGKYSATNEMTPLKYRGKRYELHTCCKMCAEAMNKLAKTDPEKFRQTYISRFDKFNIVAKNKHTRKEVQILKLMK